MCTLSFVPGLPLGGYLLAHNRDESLRRGPGLPPVMGRLGTSLVLAPRDSDAGGTWIGVDGRGHCLAILNGDGPPAAPPPPDARSRGLLVTDLLQDARPVAVRAALQERASAGTLRSRPFKLVVVAPGSGGGVVLEHGLPGVAPPQASLLRADWDGQRLQFTTLGGPRCIVSSTYRPEAVAAARGAAFTALLASLPREEDLLRARLAGGAAYVPPPRAPEDLGWITDPEPVAAALRAHHASHAPGAPQGDAFSVCMHREDGRTVSRTLLVVGPREIRMEYVAGSPCLGAAPTVTSMPRR